LVQKFEKDHDDYHSIMAKALADRLAEAFAEKMHEMIRKSYWGYAKDENLSIDELIHEKYRHSFNRKLRHVSGCFGFGTIFRSS